jgi:hypothetical protein
VNRNLLVGSVFAVLVIAVVALVYLNFGAPAAPAPQAAATRPRATATPAARPGGPGAPPSSPTPPAPARPVAGKTRIVLYFQGADVGMLFPEEREADDRQDGNARARLVLEELARGPKKDLLPTIPEGTGVREVYFDAAGTAYVDFTRGLRDNHRGGSVEELMTVESIVNTLARNVPEVQSVQFLIEGKTVLTLAGHVDLSLPLRPGGARMAE